MTLILEKKEEQFGILRMSQSWELQRLVLGGASKDQSSKYASIIVIGPGSEGRRSAHAESVLAWADHSRKGP